MGNYPAYDAQQSFGGLGQVLANLAFQRQRLAASTQYDQARMANMEELRRQEALKIALQQALNQAQIGHLTSQSGEADARAKEALAHQAILAEQLFNARTGSQAFADALGATQINPLANGQGPTIANANTMTQQKVARDALASMAMSQYLSPSGGNPLELQKALNFQDARNTLPMTPGLARAIMLGAKPMAVGPQNGVYNPDTGQIDPMMPQKLAPGNTMYPMIDGVPGTSVTAPGKPLPLADPNKAFASTHPLLQAYINEGVQNQTNSVLYPDFIRLRNFNNQLLDQLSQQYGTSTPARPAAPMASGTDAPLSRPINAAPSYTPRDKAIRANALSIANPSWTRQQVIDVVNQEMP